MRMGTAMAPVCLLLAAAAVAQGTMTPAQTIAAVGKAPEGVTATIEMVVASTGAGGFQVYFNSAADYRSQENLTVELFPGARGKLVERLGAQPEDVMTGKRIRVKGVAKRVPIPSRDGTTAYQTRIAVNTVDQITLLD